MSILIMAIYAAKYNLQTGTNTTACRHRSVDQWLGNTGLLPTCIFVMVMKFLLSLSHANQEYGYLL